MNELKYCKFCDKEKPVKDFCKSGFAIKNICKECQNKKQTQIYKNSKEVDELKQENKRLKEEIEEYKNPIKYFKYANKNVTDENKKLNGTIQTYDILLKSNIEENKQLQERMEYLERSNNRREDIIIEQRQEISDLEDNWDELKGYLHNVDVVVDYSENYDGHFINYDELIDKMQELEQGSDSNENN